MLARLNIQPSFVRKNQLCRLIGLPQMTQTKPNFKQHCHT